MDSDEEVLYVLQQYNVIDKIGGGLFGAVFKCRDTVTNQIVALKAVALFENLPMLHGCMLREVSTLKVLKHVNIVRLLNVIRKTSFVFLVFEHLDTNLHALISRRHKPLESHLIKKLLYQILCGLSYCHSNHVVHGDLSPTNVLINLEKEVAKIAKFHIAKDVRFPLSKQTSAHFCGEDNKDPLEGLAPYCYRAPELLLGCTEYTTSIDLWSVGCIFVEMVIADRPFRSTLKRGVLSQINRFFDLPLLWPYDIPHLFQEEFPKVSREMLQNRAFYPIDLEPEGFDLLSKMLCFNPVTRITAADALVHPYFKDIFDTSDGHP